MAPLFSPIEPTIDAEDTQRGGRRQLRSAELRDALLRLRKGWPRGLRERELQVISYAVSGQTNKLIAYQLGLSKGRVSTLIRSAMRKLGVQTRAQLVKKLRDLSSVTGV